MIELHRLSQWVAIIALLLGTYTSDIAISAGVQSAQPRCVPEVLCLPGS